MRPNIVILGAGGHAKVCIDVLRSLGHNKLLCIDNNKSIITCNSVEVKHGDDILWEMSPERFTLGFVAIGKNSLRATLLKKLEEQKYEVLGLISPQASVSPTAKIGSGSIIMPGAIVNADAVIGSGVIVNSGAIVEHDAVVGDYAHVAPGSVITGGVSIGALAFVGARAVVLPGVEIGTAAVVGAGAVVTRCVQPSTTVAGVPARLLKT
jgi:UDP-perosamine 4-acetyltransferase